MENFQEQFNTSIKKYAEENQYNVSAIPIHTHNGIDSPKIPFENINSYSSYVALSRVTLSKSQILALHTTPITIVPKQGTGSTTASSMIGSVIIVENITAKIIYGGTAYTGANALEFRYTDASGAKVTADIPNTFINSASTAYASVAGVTTVLTPVSNSPIIVTVPTADPGAGNGTIQLVIKYRIVNL